MLSTILCTEWLVQVFLCLRHAIGADDIVRLICGYFNMPKLVDIHENGKINFVVVNGVAHMFTIPGEEFGIYDEGILAIKPLYLQRNLFLHTSPHMVPEQLRTMSMDLHTIALTYKGERNVDDSDHDIDQTVRIDYSLTSDHRPEPYIMGVDLYLKHIVQPICPCPAFCSPWEHKDMFDDGIDHCTLYLPLNEGIRYQLVR